MWVETMTKPKTFSTALFALLLAARVLALDIYVATNGTGDGSSWADATNSLTGAVAEVENAAGGTVFLSNGVYAGVSLSLEYTTAIIGKTGNPDDIVLVGTGDAVLIEGTDIPANVSGITFTNGGGWCPLSTVNLTDCIVSGNSGSYAGAFYFGTAVRCVFEGNTSSIGSAIGGTAALYNCLIVNNTGGTAGATDDANLWNCTISGNSGTVGGIAEAGIVYNCISFDNIGGQDGKNIREHAKYSCGSNYTGTGSITNDPLFVGSGDYRLQAGSPCINTGTNSTWTTLTDTDLDGNKRRWPANGQADMGAYEFGSQPEYLKKVFLMKSN